MYSWLAGGVKFPEENMPTTRNLEFGVLCKPLLLAFLLLLLVTSAFAAAPTNITATKSISITVEVRERTLVDIQPNSLSWTGSDAVDPGSTGVDKGVQIENIGSTNISYIWFNTTYPTTRPFGSGNPALYNPGNFVIIKRNTTGSPYYFVNLVEYNETRPIYLTLAGTCTTNGRFRMGGEEFFWCLDPDVNGDCNSSAANFYIGKTAHNQSQTGTVDFSGSCDAGLTATGGNDCRTGTLTGTASNWGWGDVIVGQNQANNNYSIAVNQQCTTIHFYHWNKDEPGATSGTNIFAEYFVSPTQGILAPGGYTIGNVRVKVPYGTPVGTMSNGVLTVMAMAVNVNG